MRRGVALASGYSAECHARAAACGANRAAQVLGMEPNQNPANLAEPSNLAHLASLEGVSGRVRVECGGEPLATIEVESGDVRLAPVSEAFEAVFVTCDRSDLERLLAGELNPVLASIQGRLAIHGNVEFAVRLFLALRAARMHAQREEG